MLAFVGATYERARVVWDGNVVTAGGVTSGIDGALHLAALLRGLVGFNVGVEIGQLLFVAVFLPALMWLARGRGARLTPRIASLTVAAIGTYWLVERIFVG